MIITVYGEYGIKSRPTGWLSKLLPGWAERMITFKRTGKFGPVTTAPIDLGDAITMKLPGEWSLGIGMGETVVFLEAKFKGISVHKWEVDLDTLDFKLAADYAGCWVKCQVSFD